jgi:hypothetical protein
MEGSEIRKVLLTVIDEFSRQPATSFQSRSILSAAARRLNIERNLEAEQALLTYWHDLLRTGHIAWGYDVGNADPPFCHLTEQGRRALAHLSRDPMNPDGYMAYLRSKATLKDVPLSYIAEALRTYTADCYKATAVMVGGATECIVLQIRDTLLARMKANGSNPPSKLSDWRIKVVLDAIEGALNSKKSNMPPQLSEAFESYWLAFTGQIRAARNDAGHPNSIAPVTSETVHASLLIFPELAKLASDLEQWINTAYS